MNYSIKDLRSLKELQDFFKENYHLIIQKEKCFLNAMVSEWDEGILSDKLVSFSEGEMAQMINKINPNQSQDKICQELYQTIMKKKACSHGESSVESFHYDIGENATSDTEWSVYL